LTSLPGGAADKSGNRYEHWWTAVRIADVLEGHASRIRLEPPGVGGQGIEFEVDQDGATWAEQVKEASSGGNWTINRLNREGVLTAAQDQLGAGRTFRFVASTPASQLADLAERARDTETFAEYEEVLTEELVADLQNLAATWNVTAQDAWAQLKFVYTEQYSVASLRQLATIRFKLLFAGDAEVVLAELRRFCDDHLHESLTAPQIWSHLKSKGFRRRHLVGDANALSSLHDTVERHQRRVSRSVPSIGLVPSSFAGRILDRLRAPDGAQLILLDGRAGFGKSTVVAAVAETLESEGWFVAVARMDSVDSSTNTSDQLGVAIGLTDSPAVLLAGVADGSPALLIIDQLDAVSTYSGRIPDGFDAIEEILDEIATAQNIKVLLVVRTVDLEADPRLRRIAAESERVERHTVGQLDLEEMEAKLASTGIPRPTSAATLELLRTPLHLTIFSRLSSAAQQLPYRTLQELYDRYTEQVRVEVERGVGHLDWQRITSVLVDYMNDHEVMTAPATVLAGATIAEVHALESESIIVRDGAEIAFFHESYFDYLFAQTFVTSGRDLHEFLATSGQLLFRRAQTRQILEHLAATDRQRFRVVVAQLLSSSQIRPHLKEVIVDVLTQLDPDGDDWAAIDDIAWEDTPIGRKLLALLSRPGWFDAADALGHWERWLADPTRVNAAFHQLLFAARHRPDRAEELVGPYVATSEEWRLRLKALIEWSLQPTLIDFAVELVERGQLDDARGPIAVNSDFWSIVYGLSRNDPAAAARLIGAYLDRGLQRARADGSSDPFASEHLSADSQSHSVISEVAQTAPAEFLRHVVTFVKEIAVVDQSAIDGRLPVGQRWGLRYRDSAYSVDDVVFEGVEEALRQLATHDAAQCDDVLTSLRDAESDELRFLACRALAVRGRPDDALTWLIDDQRNLLLGWADSPRWASRELIEACTPSCSDEVFARVEEVILRYSAHWESRQSRGRAQYQLLSAMDPARLSEGARRRLGELERRFPDRQPEAPTPVMAHMVGSPIPEAASKLMSDEDWLRALHKYTVDETDWRGTVPSGGAGELAQQLGQRAEEDPERFAALGLRLDRKVHAAAFDNIIRSIAGRVASDLLTDVCEHASRLHGGAVGRTICSAAQQSGAANPRMVELIAIYAEDPDPDREWAQTTAGSGRPFYGGDLRSAGLNSTRGQAALAAASVLFATDQHRDRLLPVVERLASDQVLGVRVCAAEAVLSLLNHEPESALVAADRLFDTSIDVLDTYSSERLLMYAVLRDPDRFANVLARALDGPDSIAQRAGHVWAMAFMRDALPDTIAREVSQLAAPARRGAAEVLAANADTAVELLRTLFDDDDVDVRKQAARAMRHLKDVPANAVNELVKRFTSSAAFVEHFDDLVDAPENITAILPEVAISACGRAVELAGADLANIRTARSMMGQPVMTVVLRLYRQGDAEIRSRCLDIIDRLSELNAYGVAEALTDER
jgi:hypothetical protein